MEVLGTRVAIIAGETSVSEASLIVAGAMSRSETEQAVTTLTKVVELAFNYDDRLNLVNLSYVAQTDIQI